jgi:hypothetical protein
MTVKAFLLLIYLHMLLFKINTTQDKRMSDNVEVELTVLTRHIQAVLDIDNGYNLITTIDATDEHPSLTVLHYEDIRFANLEFEEKLINAKIPFEKTFSAGELFAAGVEVHQILDDSSWVHKHCVANLLDTLPLSKAIEAYRADNMNAFLGEQMRIESECPGHQD